MDLVVSNYEIVKSIKKVIKLCDDSISSCNIRKTKYQKLIHDFSNLIDSFKLYIEEFESEIESEFFEQNKMMMDNCKDQITDYNNKISIIDLEIHRYNHLKTSYYVYLSEIDHTNMPQST